MSLILTQPVTGPAAWTAADFRERQDWVYPLSPASIAVLDAALATLKARGLRYPDFTREDFPIEALAPQLNAWADALEDGRGFVVVRGIPVERYTDEEVQAVCYGLGLHLGRPVRQNPRGDLLGTVSAVGNAQDRHTRVYETNLYLPYHTDPSDVVGLLCQRKAKEGGLSSLVSVAAIYNQILAEHPEYLGLYYKRWYMAHLCQDTPALSALFSYHEGKLSCRYLRQYIELGHEIMGLPLSAVEIKALDIFDEAIHNPEHRIDMMLERGDLQLANNNVVLHSRTGFEDHDDPTQRRRLLRLWLQMPNARSHSPDFPGRNGFPDPVPAAAPATV